MAGRFLRGLIAVPLLLLLAVPVFGEAPPATKPEAAVAAPKTAGALLWGDLTVEQKRVLAPLAPEWNRLLPQQRKRLLMMAKRYPKMSVEQKERVRSRLEEWSKLTPEQREKARHKFVKLYQLPPEKRQEIRRKWSERPTEAVAPAVVPPLQPESPVPEGASAVPSAPVQQ